MTLRAEDYGPTERLLQTLLTYTDHMYHGRPGLVVPDARAPMGVTWLPAGWREDPETHVRMVAVLDPRAAAASEAAASTASKGKGKRTSSAKAGRRRVVVPRTVVGRLEADGSVVAVAATPGGPVAPIVLPGFGPLGGGGALREGAVVGQYRAPGLYPEVALWMWQQVTAVWRLDNEFLAKWASYAFAESPHQDLKVVLAAFALVQTRRGDPVRADAQGPIEFHDADYRDVGAAMMLLRKPPAGGKTGAPGAGGGGGDFDPKRMLRVYSLLNLPAIAAANRALGFNQTERRRALGRWPQTVRRWLRNREQNPWLLEGLVRAGFRQQVMELAELTGYIPESTRFYQTLRWKQKQAPDGRRQLAIGETVAPAVTWDGLTEEQICQRIMREKPNYKRLVAQVPTSVGLTRAVVAAAIESGALSNKDLVIMTPTLEELGLLEVPTVKAAWERALAQTEDQRALHIATRVQDQGTKEKLEVAAETAAKVAVAEAAKGLRIWFVVDRSSSMDVALDLAKTYVARVLSALPADKVHVSVFNQVGSLLTFQQTSVAGVMNAFQGIAAGGGTDYAAGVRAACARGANKPLPDEDLLCLFVGDEEDPRNAFAPVFAELGVKPMAFGLLRVVGPCSMGNGQAVRLTAAALGVPCFPLDEKIFADAYAVPRVLRELIAATPVDHTGRAAMQAAGLMPAVPVVRKTLVEQVLDTKLLKSPAYYHACA